MTSGASDGQQEREGIFPHMINTPGGALRDVPHFSL